MKQSQATQYIKDLLKGRKIDLEPGIVLLGGNEPWQVFEYKNKCLAIDPDSGIWIGPVGGEWEHLGVCTVSGALRGIEFLVQ